MGRTYTLAFLLLCLLGVFFLAAPVFAEAEAVENALVPNLSIDIPGVSFSQVLKENGVLEVSFIGDYISGVYKYLLGIGTTIAIVFIMIAGLQYTLSAGGGDAKQAKEKIRNAVTGVVLLLSVYAILFIVNPSLTFFQSLKLESIEAVGLTQIANEWATTPDTSGTATGGSHTPAFTSCPISLSSAALKAPNNAEEDPRNQEFFAQIGSVITGTTTAEKIAQISDAAAVCDVRFGSCGKTIETISALAGVGDQSCLTQGDTCRTYEGSMQQTHQIPMQNILQLSKFVCGEECGEGWAADDAGCESKFSETAIANAVQFLKDAQGDDYPDSWIADLQPGDVLWYYNANSACGGLHSVLFMGDAGNGMASVVSGSMNRNATAHTICLSSSCTNMRPLVRVFRAR